MAQNEHRILPDRSPLLPHITYPPPPVRSVRDPEGLAISITALAISNLAKAEPNTKLLILDTQVRELGAATPEHSDASTVGACHPSNAYASYRTLCTCMWSVSALRKWQ